MQKKPDDLHLEDMEAAVDDLEKAENDMVWGQKEVHRLYKVRERISKMLLRVVGPG